MMRAHRSKKGKIILHVGDLCVKKRLKIILRGSFGWSIKSSLRFSRLYTKYGFLADMLQGLEVNRDSPIHLVLHEYILHKATVGKRRGELFILLRRRDSIMQGKIYHVQPWE